MVRSREIWEIEFLCLFFLIFPSDSLLIPVKVYFVFSSDQFIFRSAKLYLEASLNELKILESIFEVIVIFESLA